MNTRQIKGFGLLIFMSLSSACIQHRQPPDSEIEKVRMVHQLPQGIQCQYLKTVRLRDGQGCAYVGRTQPGSPDILLHNLQSQARRYGANLALMLSEIEPDTWEGCPANGLTIDSAFYHCSFGRSSNQD